MRFLNVFLLLLLLPALVSAVNIASCPYIINTSNNYAVTGNLAATAHCITVNASNVNVSLGGFTIDGDDGTGDYGIRVLTGFSDINIANGSLTDFGRGVEIATGASNVAIKNLSIASGTGVGIYMAGTGSITGITLQNNSITSSTYEGIYMEVTSGTPSVGGNTITQNKVFGNGVGGGNGQIVLGRLMVANVTNNNITGVTTGLATWATTSGYLNITGNLFYNITQAGVSSVYLETGNVANVYADNQFYNCSFPINSPIVSNWSNTTFTSTSGSGSVSYPSFNLSAGNTVRNATNVYIGTNFISVDSDNLPALNTTATVTLTVPVCPTKILVKTGFPTTAADISFNGVDANITPTSCVGTTAVFNVPSFSGYAPGVYVELLNATNNAAQGSANISRIFNITFYDESSGANISIDSASLSYSVFSSTLEDDIVRNYSIAYSGTVNNASVRAYPNWTNGTISGIESFAKAGYTTRSRFLVNANTNLSVLQNVNIYLLNTSSASYAIINVVNKGEAVSGAYVSILKYFSSTSTYTQTDQKVTNSNGQAAAYVEAISYYKFAVYDSSGTLLYYSSAPEQFICDGTCTITIDISDTVEFQMLTPYASANCYGNNSSNSIVYAYADGTGQTTSINFLAYRENVTAPVCNSTTAAASASYVCTLGPGENLSLYLYSCEVWRTASPAKLEYVGLLDFRLYNAIVDWFLPAIILITTLGVSAAHLPLGIGLGSVGLFVLSIMGVIAIPVSTSMPIMIVGLVLAFLLSKRGAD